MKFIKLTNYQDTTVYVNVDNISYFTNYDGQYDYTSINLNSSRNDSINSISVKETPEEILKAIKS